MSKIAFIGMGSMGARMALNLIKAGYSVCVWNRNIDRTNPLKEAGAQVAESPRAAAEGADYVITMVRDNEASKSVWCDDSFGVLSVMKSGAVAIECSTLTVDWVKELHELCENKNIEFIDAPVAGSRPQAESAQLIFFAGGSSLALELARPVIEVMGNTVHHAGPAGAGMSVKLAVNALFGIQLAAVAELIELFNMRGLDVTHAVEILTSTPVCSPAAKVASAAMLAENFSPMFPINLVEKDLSYVGANSSEGSLLLMPMTQAAMHVFQQAIQKGYGEDNITGVSQIYS